MKVVLMNPNGNVTVKILRGEEEKKTSKMNYPRKLAGSLIRSFQTLRNSSRAEKGDP